MPIAPEPTLPQRLSIPEAIIPIATLVLLLGLSFALFGAEGATGPNQVALVLATMVAVGIGWRRGHGLPALREAAIASVSAGIGVIFILFAVGSLIGTWALSGTLVAMVYYGLGLLSADQFHVTACAIAALVSLCIGNSWTVAGTVGIGLMGIAATMGLNVATAAGAVISGAYFGALVSPLSASANLAASTAGADLYAHLREALFTAVPALLAALVLFWLMGVPAAGDTAEKLQRIQAAFPVSPLLFLPLAVVGVLALLRCPPFTTIFVSALSAGALAVATAPGRVLAFAQADGLPVAIGLLKGVWLALASGYRSGTGEPAIDLLLSRGGMASMLGTIWLVIAALAFGGVIERIGALDRLIAPVIAAARGTGSLVGALAGSSIATNVVAADQYIAILLPGRMFRPTFRARGLAPAVLSRALGDAATVTSPLVPWNSCGAFMAATLGVPTYAYAPHAVLNVLAPVLTVAIAAMGLRMVRGRDSQQ
jgi:NhaC family Na+:H+ antiporter